MLYDRMKILHPGDDNGNDMIVQISLSTGRDIFALGTKNNYGGDWDLGPTWNYVVSADKPFLVDAGRRGTGPRLLEMMEYAGIKAEDLDFVILSHGHEDHDGGLFALTEATGLKVKAHETYQSLIEVEPSRAPSTRVAKFPASCWYCPMLDSFTQEHCLDYHQERRSFKITPIGQDDHDLGPGISVLHVPGHSPDCLAFVIDDEVMLTGDTILPEITPHPTREAFFEGTRCMLPSHYDRADQLYGLRAYIRSVKRLQSISKRLPGLTGLPAHRLLSRGNWNLLNVGARCDELIDHHIQRCSDIIDLLGDEPRTPEEIARAHFEPHLLKGFGIHLAMNEVISHCELMESSGDIVWNDGKVASTGKQGAESLIKEIQ
ncbi:MAG: MBL fold metallo-hydrolase [Thermodesulfobacteriota bacterium]